MPVSTLSSARRFAETDAPSNLGVVGAQDARIITDRPPAPRHPEPPQPDDQSGSSEEKAWIDGGNLPDLMDRLNRDGDAWSYATIKVSFPQSLDDLPEALETRYAEPDAEGLDPFQAFDAARQSAAQEAWEHWEALTDLTFDLVDPGEEADIYFMGREYEMYDDGSSVGGRSTGVNETDGSVITINTAVSTWDNLDVNDRGYQTLLHEIGHSIGLDHPGNYDGGQGANYEDDAEYVQDSKQYSIMSYFDADNTGASSSSGLVKSARTHDIWVTQELYGANWSTRTGDTTYGFNPSAGLAGSIYDFDNSSGSRHVTIWDADGEDTLDLLGDFGTVEIDLNPGAFSSVLGGTDNLSLAYAPGSGVAAGKNVLIENARGSFYNDRLIGNAANNILDGSTGNDTLEGGDGADTLIGGFGDDEMDGGDGLDQVDYSADDEDWQIDLLAGTATNGRGQTDTLIRIESAQGGMGNDTINGDNGGNVLHGGDGNDKISGYGGFDLIYGGDGFDTLDGGSGDDVLVGGDGMDTASYDSSPFGVTVDLAIDAYQNTQGAGTDWLIDIERLTGSTLDDDLRGDAGHNILRGHNGNDDLLGREGNDILFGGFGDDILEGGAGDDTHVGGDGRDTVSYSTATASVYVDIGALGGYNTLNAGIDTYIDIEDIIGSDHHDSLYGDDGANRLHGGDGMDLLSGGAGGDRLFGGDGRDALIGGAGPDLIDGGDGIDWVRFSSAAGIEVDLSKEEQWTGEGTDTIRNIENARGGMGDDELTGDDGANYLMGLSGDDVIFGGGGEDVFEGGFGDDVIYAGLSGPGAPPGGFIPVAANSASAGNISGTLTQETGWGGITSGGAAQDDFVFDTPVAPFNDLVNELGSGPDTIIFKNNWGHDEVHEFYSEGDILDFSGVSGVNGIVHLSIADTADGALISYGNDSVLLHDVSQSQLSDADFLF